jgi:hypothetical protein
MNVRMRLAAEPMKKEDRVEMTERRKADLHIVSRD